MKLNKFIAQLSDICEIRNKNTNLDEITVYIKTNNHSVGYSSAIEVNSLNLGFDWDNGRLFIYPKEPLVLEKTNRDVIKEPLDFNKTFPYLADPNATKIRWICANCEEPVSIKDNFCRKCGQRLR